MDEKMSKIYQSPIHTLWGTKAVCYSSDVTAFHGSNYIRLSACEADAYTGWLTLVLF